MKLVISPAKSLNYESELPTGFSSESCFLNEAKQLNALLKKKSAKTLSELMHISPKLGALNYERNQNWSLALVFTTRLYISITPNQEMITPSLHSRV